MAFIRRGYNDQEGQGENGLYTEGESGVSGQNDTQSTPTGGQQKSKAATPGSWYNIQDFLSANQSAIPKMQEGIKGKAQELIDQDKAKADTAISEISGIDRGSANIFNSDIAKTGTADQIRAGLTQDFNPMDYSGYNFSQNETLAGLKPGDFNSVSQFNKSTQKNKPGYTMGMGKMDDLLLGSDPNFTQELAPWTQNQYQEQVTNPLQQTIGEAQTKDTEADAAYDAAKQGWWSGTKDFLSGNQKSIADKLAEQQGIYDTESSKKALDVFNKNVKAPTTNFGYLDWDDYVKDNASKYATLTKQAPTQETAAYGSLGEQGISQYNMISDILGGLDSTTNYGKLSGQEFVNPKWDVNKNKAVSDYERTSANAELTKSITPGLKQLGNQLNNYESTISGIKDEIESAKANVSKLLLQGKNQEAEQARQGILALQDQLKYNQDLYDATDTTYGKLKKRQSEITKFLNSK